LMVRAMVTHSAAQPILAIMTSFRLQYAFDFKDAVLDGL
jgi:hypothetical protein